ncbi:MAG TPA: iron-containing alcohol dehydrogenase [Spirochaetia bacterium]|nr:iron-containing alcohol dehydrogenase [Spirochaetia bacterium]
MDKSIQFNFFVPTDIIFGRGSLGRLPDLPQVKGKRCMLFCFPGFSGKDTLEKLKQNCALFIQAEDFEENPSYSLAQKLGKQVADRKIETVIAIGGGSSIDTAKAAAWMSLNPSGQVPPEEAVPVDGISIVAVPTTAGTGSEVTLYSILTESETGKKQILKHPTLFPSVALCDPELTASMPRHVTANTGIDAISHSVEAYLSKTCQGFMEDLALASCRLLKENLPAALDRPRDGTAREAVMLAALEGGLVLARCGTVIVHALGYCITREFHFPHGYSNALLLAGFVNRLAEKGSDRAARVLDIFNGDLSGFISRAGIEQKLPKEKVNDQMLGSWIDTGYDSYGRPNCVLPLEREDIRFILENTL